MKPYQRFTLSLVVCLLLIACSQKTTGAGDVVQAEASTNWEAYNKAFDEYFLLYNSLANINWELSAERKAQVDNLLEQLTPPWDYEIDAEADEDTIAKQTDELMSKLPEMKSLYESLNNNEEQRDEEAQANEESDSKHDSTQFNPDDGPIIIGYTNPKSVYDTIDLRCDFTMFQLDINNRETRRVFEFPKSNDYRLWFTSSKGKPPIAAGIGELTEYKCRQLFNYDLTRCAVEFNKNGERHVGWIDNDGIVTDISQIIHPGGTGFASTTPEDTCASFTPDGLFLFSDQRAEKYVWVDPDTCSIVRDMEFVDRMREVFTFPDEDGINSASLQDVRSPRDTTIHDFSEDRVAYGIYSKNSNGNITYAVCKMLDETSDPIILTPDTEYVIQKVTYHNGMIAFKAERNGKKAIFVMNEDDTDSIIDITDMVPAEYKEAGHFWDLFFW